MIIKAVCGNGIGSSLLVAMNIRTVLDKNHVDYEEVEHINISSFSGQGVDWVVCGADIAPALDFPDDKKVILHNILSKEELETKLRAKLKF